MSVHHAKHGGAAVSNGFGIYASFTTQPAQASHNRPASVHFPRKRSEAGVRARLISSRSVRALSRDRRGSVAVEFSFIAIPFFMLLFGVLETGLVFFGNSMLDKATADAARLVRTGQAQAQNMTASQFHDYICTQV